MEISDNYEWVDLPSEGQCYHVDSPLRCGKIKIGYLTAKDENILMSGNTEINDIIISKKIVDKTINPSILVNGDRNAILLWLRKTSYGNNFNITVRNNNENEIYDTNIDLSLIKNKVFTLVGNKDGHFMYFTKNNDVLHFKYLTYNDLNRFEHDNFSDEKNVKDFTTEFLKLITVSVNGNDDRKFVDEYIENLSFNEKFFYISFVEDNKPDIDNNVTLNISKKEKNTLTKVLLLIDNTFLINLE